MSLRLRNVECTRCATLMLALDSGIGAGWFYRSSDLVLESLLGRYRRPECLKQIPTRSGAADRRAKTARAALPDKKRIDYISEFPRKQRNSAPTCRLRLRNSNPRP